MKVNEKSRADSQPSTLRALSAVTAGAAIGVFPLVLYAKGLTTPISDLDIEINKLKADKQHPALDTFEKIKGYADDILQKTGLKDKGVKIEIWTPENISNLKPKTEPQSFMKKMFNIISVNQKKALAHGLNAFFMPKNNRVRINNERKYSAVFHEIGHAMNYNNSKIMKLMQQSRPFCNIALPVVAISTLGVGLFKNRKYNESEESQKGTITNFIKNNAGKLTFATWIPILFEEGIASLKGIKLAKPYLSEAQHILHKNNLTKAFSSYLLLPAVVGGAVTLGIFTKDHLREKKKSS